MLHKSRYILFQRETGEGYHLKDKTVQTLKIADKVILTNAELTLKIFTYLYCHMLVLNNLKLSSISQIFLHKLGSSSLVHTDSDNAVEGCTSFWHLLLLILPTSATTIVCCHALYELPF